MPPVTKNRALSDREFLNQISSIEGKSPIIDELVRRLDYWNTLYESGLDEASRKQAECPVCNANLIVSVDDDAESYQLKPS